jgi:serine/threonine-protein phosphatase 2A activator
MQSAGVGVKGNMSHSVDINESMDSVVSVDINESMKSDHISNTNNDNINSQYASATTYNLHRQILVQSDLSAFLSSQAFSKIETFLHSLNDSVKGVSLPDAEKIPETPVIGWVLQLLEASSGLIDAFPPRDRNADVNRFGNVAFRDWLFALQDRLVPEKMAQLPVAVSDSLRAELSGYFINSLGSSQRIDYGTGHEVHFLLFMMGIHETGPVDKSLLVLRVFFRYMKLMRKLQKTYWLEPAGSHGVWGLDDYHFLPFLFGSSQLRGHENIRPRAVHSMEIVHYLAPQYIYFDSILNILEIKSSSNNDSSNDHSQSDASALRWLSPVLDDISIVKTWDKINSGLLKMWKVEVMSKLPIMQHLLFGTEILQFTRENDDTNDTNDTNDNNTDNTNHYVHSLRGDCCGNPLPSIYAAERRQPGLPFD